MATSATKLKDTSSLGGKKKTMTNLDIILKSRDIILLFPVIMYGCESWNIKKAKHQRTDVFKFWCWRRLWNSLGQQGDQTSQNLRKSILNIIGRPDAEAPIVWPPDAKNWLIGKDPDAAKDWQQKEKGITEDEMVPWHHQLNSHVSEQSPGYSERQGSLACCSPWSHKWSDTT